MEVDEMAVIVGVFRNQVLAEDALLRLKNAGVPDDDVALVSHAPTVSPVEVPAESAEPDESITCADDVTTAAALGTAVGVIAGGGLMGPLGAVMGGVAGGGIGGLLSARGLPEREAQEAETRFHDGRVLVAVETDSRSTDVQVILDEAGAEQIEVDGAADERAPAGTHTDARDRV
jgi:hypothetical protein